jgi:division protein CdvB (Snf7/Vps24/ESCRT-III family)
MRLLPLILVLVAVTSAEAGVYLTITRSGSSGPSAREQAAAEARRQIDQAQAEYRRAYAKVVADHPMSFDLRQARLALARAYSRLNDVRSGLIAELRSDAAYRKADLLVLEREQQLRREKDPEKRIELAEDLLRLRTHRTELETEAFAGNVDLTVALAGVQSAKNELEAVEKMYRWHLTQSDQLSAARSRLDSARDQLAGVGN